MRVARRGTNNIDNDVIEGLFLVVVYPRSRRVWNSTYSVLVRITVRMTEEALSLDRIVLPAALCTVRMWSSPFVTTPGSRHIAEGR